MVGFEYDHKNRFIYRMRIVFIFILLISTTLLRAQDAELANSYFIKGQYEKAIRLYEPLFESNPIRQDYFKSLLTCYQQLEKYEQANDLLKSQLLRFPNQVYLYVEIGHNFQLQNENEKAVDNYEKAISFIYKQPGYSFMVGRAFSQNHLLDYALRSYQLAKELNPKLNTEINEAHIYGEKGDFEKMFELYLNMLAKNDNYYTVVQRNIAHFISEDKNSPNNILLKKQLLERAQSQPNNSWNILLSWLFMQQNEYNRAFVQERSIYKRNPGNLNRILEVGLVSFDNRDFETSMKAFVFIRNNFDPTVMPHEWAFKSDIYLMKIKTFQQDGSQKLMNLDETYLNLIEQYGFREETLELQFDYADFLCYFKKEPKLAIGHLEEFLTFVSSELERAKIQMKIADILVYSNQFNQALILYTKIQTENKNSVISQEARFKVAQTSYFKGDFLWAQNQLKVLKSSTSQLIANDALELNLKIATNFDKDSSNLALLDFAQAEFLSFQKKNSEAITLFESILNQYKGQEIEDDTLFKMGQIHSVDRDFISAEIKFLTLLDLHPDSIWADDAIFNLAELYHFQLNDVVKAGEMYERIIFEFPSSIHLVASRKGFRSIRGDEL